MGCRQCREPDRQPADTRKCGSYQWPVYRLIGFRDCFRQGPTLAGDGCQLPSRRRLYPCRPTPGAYSCSIRFPCFGSAPWSGLTGIPSEFADGADDGSSYTAGFGLSLSSNEFAVTGAPWAGLANIPAGFADGIDNDTFYTAGAGLVLTNTQFSLSFAGSGATSTVARSDHNHNGIYALLSHTHAGRSISSRYCSRCPYRQQSCPRFQKCWGLCWLGMGAAAGETSADLLDGHQGKLYQNASNLNTGTLGNAYFSAYGDLSAEGYLDF